MKALRFLLAVGIALAWLHAAGNSVAADDGDAVEGAIWRYTMTRVVGKATRAGRFRIFGTEIFQGRRGAEKDNVVGTIDGKFEPPRGVVVVTFTNLGARDAQPMSFKGRVTRADAGKAEGRLVDGDGFHWDFKAERIRE